MASVSLDRKNKSKTMQHVIVENINSPLKTPLYAKYCASFFCHLKGLAFRRRINNNEGLLLVYRRENRFDTAIHMLFVFFDLAIVWIDAQMRVVDVRHAKSWTSMIAPRAAAKYVLEVSAERLVEFNVGDQMVFQDA